MKAMAGYYLSVQISVNGLLSSILKRFKSFSAMRLRRGGRLGRGEWVWLKPIGLGEVGLGGMKWPGVSAWLDPAKWNRTFEDDQGLSLPRELSTL
jgi:hypothetical protein